MEQITLNMIPKGITPICHASQYDKGRVIRLNIMDGLQGYVLSNESVQLNVRKPDMNIVTTDVDTTSGNTFVDIITTEQMTACEGDNLCEIVLSAGDVVIASLNFIMRVEVDVLKDGIESETEIHNLTTQIEAINEEIVPDMVAEEVANQYDSSNVIFDDHPIAGHGTGYVVKSENVPDELNDLDDVEIDSPTSNQALVYNPTTQKWENGEVSTVGSIDDLDDVDTTGKATGDNLRYDGNEWIAKPNTIEMTLAEWNAIADKQAWRNAHKNTYLVISDAPNLNATAKEISYEGSTDTVWDKVEEIKPTFNIGGATKAVNDTYQIPANILSHSIINIGLRRYAYCGSVTIITALIADGAYANGLVVYSGENKFATFSISATGLITITKITNWDNVYIDLIGLF